MRYPQEQWNTIPGVGDRYEASTEGRIRRAAGAVFGSRIFLDCPDVQPKGFGERVRKAYRAGESQSSLARRIGVCQPHISHIVNGLRRKED